MRHVAAIIVAVMTFTLLAVLDVGCEAVHDRMGDSAPIVYQIANAFSPFGATYFIIPILAGAVAWFSSKESYVWLIPAILVILISVVLISASNAFILLDGDRPFSPYRYAANATMIAFGLWVLIRGVMQKKKEA